MCLYAISFTVFEADLQIYWLPVLLFFTITCIIMFLFLWVIYIFHYMALFCPLLVFLDGVLHTIENVFGMFPGRLLFFLFCGCYSVVLV